MRKLEECFIAFWCVVMPVTSFVVIPAVPGTIPAYLLALASTGFVAARLMSGAIEGRVFGYFKILFSIVILWALLLAGSQLGHILNNRHDFGDVSMVAPTDSAVLFRVELFTQSMYFFACVLIALYFRFFFQPHMMRYVFWGGYLMACYGIYEWLFFLVFKESGDFLGNRVYAMGTDDSHTGSWSQDIDFAGIDLLRIKSTFGEPSFFAAAVIPYLFLAMDGRKFALTGLLFFAAFFSTSTSCYLSLAACFLVRIFWIGKNIRQNIGIVFLFGFGICAMSQMYPDTFGQLFRDKFYGDNDSGRDHQRQINALTDLLGTFSPVNWIFGVGLGYVYTNATIAVLFDGGLIGLVVFIYLFWKPILGLRGRDAESLGLKSALFGMFVAFTINVSELYLPTTWMFLGLAYWKLGRERAPVKPSPSQGVVWLNQPLEVERPS
jgi:hypothetical protein